MESIRLKYLMEHMLESFIYFPETTFEEEKSQSSADSNNSKKRNHKAVLTATIVVTVIIAILKCMHEIHINVPINRYF